MTKRLYETPPDLGCPVCGNEHRSEDDCNDWPYEVPARDGYPFAPKAPAKRRQKKAKPKRGRRKKDGPQAHRAHLGPDEDR